MRTVRLMPWVHIDRWCRRRCKGVLRAREQHCRGRDRTVWSPSAGAARLHPVKGCRITWTLARSAATEPVCGSRVQARMAVANQPFTWDPCALAELIQAQELRSDSEDLRPGSRSLLQQVTT